MLSSHVAVSVAWPSGSYARALGFGALCWYTGSSTTVFPPSVRHSLRATAAPASDRDPLEGNSGASSRGNSSSNSLYVKRTTAKAFAKDVFINQERKLGARRRSDTVLVSTINDADQGSTDVTFRTPLAPYEKSKFLGSGGSMVARLKLKGIDGRAPPGVEPAA
ncbi:hypothetical protein TEA_029578 [Camellia sinensis var. sinensis]|uniref:Uncharacterized protein n=1 Tax=Camellia sinensis var. sinensis TaxID=542762 RepID=A0A4S4DNY3_CAMSN|nr:hypothetical protein TEA_029578 [Camellia sinensis var. sinensis]